MPLVRGILANANPAIHGVLPISQKKYHVRFFVTPKPTNVDEHLEPNTRPYHEEFSKVQQLYHAVLPILKHPPPVYLGGIEPHTYALIPCWKQGSR